MSKTSSTLRFPLGNIPVKPLNGAAWGFNTRIINTLAIAVATFQYVVIVLRDGGSNSKGDADGRKNELVEIHRWLKEMFLVVVSLSDALVGCKRYPWWR